MRFTTCCFYFFLSESLKTRKNIPPVGFVISPRKKQRRYNGDTQFIYWFSCGGGGGGLLWILFFNWTKSSLNCCLMCLFNYDTTTFARNKSPLLANVSKKHTYFTFVLQSGSLTFAATDIKCIFMLISIQTVVGKKKSQFIFWFWFESQFLQITFEVTVAWY